MRKIFTLLILVLFITAGCDGQDNISPAKEDSGLADNKIYFFYYNECPFCHDAMDYINDKYPDLEITMINIHNPGGYKLLVECAKKFNLGHSVGTPLFCMGNKYLMGWSNESPRQFDEYVKLYLP